MENEIVFILSGYLSTITELHPYIRHILQYEGKKTALKILHHRLRITASALRNLSEEKRAITIFNELFLSKAGEALALMDLIEAVKKVAEEQLSKQQK